MAITMKNYGLTWTDTAGVPRATVCGYGEASAGQRKEKLVAAGCDDVRVVKPKPGQLLQPQG